MTFETVVESLSCLGTTTDLCGFGNAGGCCSWVTRALSFFFFAADMANLVLDFMFVARLSNMGERGMSALLAIFTCFGFIVWAYSRCMLSDSEKIRDYLYVLVLSELMIYTLEDVTTLFIFATVDGAYEPDGLSSVVNLWITMASGWITVCATWMFILMSAVKKPGGDDVVCFCCCGAPYIILATLGTAYFTSFAFQFLVPAKEPLNIANTTEGTKFTLFVSESIYIPVQSLGWMSACMILISFGGP